MSDVSHIESHVNMVIILVNINFICGIQPYFKK